MKADIDIGDLRLVEKWIKALKIGDKTIRIVAGPVPFSWLVTWAPQKEEER